jgi:hypothetical protein
MTKTDKNLPLPAEESISERLAKAEVIIKEQAEALKERDDVIKEHEATINDLHDVIREVGDLPSSSMFSVHVNEQMLISFLAEADDLNSKTSEWFTGPILSPTQRRTLLGVRQRRYGIIDEISDILKEFSEFMPPSVNEEEFKTEIRSFEIVRNINISIAKTQRITLDTQLVLGDSIYRKAMTCYGYLRKSAKRRIPGAEKAFDRVKTFFENRRHTGESEMTTKKKLERDVKALEKGTLEGEIYLSNEADQVLKGHRTVIDDTHRKSGHWKEKESGEVGE